MTGDRYRFALKLAPADSPHGPERGSSFVSGTGGSGVDLKLRLGLVSDEFVRLVRRGAGTPAEVERLAWVKQDMADRLLSLAADEVYDVSVSELDAGS